MVEKKGNTGWTQIPFLPLVKDACNVFQKYYPDVFVDLLRQMKVKNPDKCPIPPVSILLNKNAQYGVFVTVRDEMVNLPAKYS